MIVIWCINHSSLMRSKRVGICGPHWWWCCLMCRPVGHPGFFNIKHSGTSWGVQKQVKHRHMATMRQLSGRLVIKEPDKWCGQDVEVKSRNLSLTHNPSKRGNIDIEITGWKKNTVHYHCHLVNCESTKIFVFLWLYVKLKTWYRFYTTQIQIVSARGRWSQFI